MSLGGNESSMGAYLVVVLRRLAEHAVSVEVPSSSNSNNVVSEEVEDGDSTLTPDGDGEGDENQTVASAHISDPLVESRRSHQRGPLRDLGIMKRRCFKRLFRR